MVDRKGNNILMIAVKFGQAEMIELMLSSNKLFINA